MPRDVFVATATAIALFVDAARMPVYAVTAHEELWAMRAPMLIATIGVVAGTIMGMRVLRGIPEAMFRKIVAIVLAILGVALLVRAS